MKPSPRLIKIIVALFMLSALAGFARFFASDLTQSLLSSVWQLCVLGLLILVVIDRLLSGSRSAVSCVRDHPSSLALGAKSTLSLSLKNESPRSLSLVVSEIAAQELNITAFPARVELQRGQTQTLKYSVMPERRGDIAIEATQVFVSSLLGLWQLQYRLPVVSHLKVFPNFMAVSHLALLLQGGSSKQLGIHLLQRRGQGTDFHQMRDYRESDSLRQVDWCSTAKVGKLISREFQDERDQQVIFLLDCGRRMRAKDQALSHFDHALNALLLTAFIALRQGDAAGYHTFAGDAWGMKPAKGPHAINALINQLYRIESSVANSDYIAAAETIASKRYKRSLVILVSNVREEDEDDLVVAVKLLSRHHLVLVATLREAILDEVVERPIASLTDALTYAGTIHHVNARSRIIKRLAAEGVIVSDCLPSELPMALVNQYLALKSSGKF
ncbi:MAG TPA: DUF58 domain-containing protein [Cellvibrio sp.]|nr:DUF58 domain-containing protein [Cellvibrio sp.]